MGSFFIPRNEKVLYDMYHLFSKTSPYGNYRKAVSSSHAHKPHSRGKVPA